LDSTKVSSKLLRTFQSCQHQKKQTKRTMVLTNKLIYGFLLLSVLSMMFVSGRIHLLHHTIELNEDDNLKNHLLNQKHVEGQHIQVMIHCKDEEQVSMVRQSLGKDHLHHIIPPQTIIVHEELSVLSERMKQLSQEVKDAIEWIGHVKPHFKSPLLVDRGESAIEIVNDVQEEFIVKLVHRNEPMTNQLTTRLLSHFSSSKRSLEYSNTKVIVSSDNVLRVHTMSSEMRSVVEHIAKQEEVLWIERRKPVALMNYAASQIIQSDGTSTSDTLTGEDAIWNQGITGQGEVIAVADTGIDYDMCFFRDTQRAVPFQKTDTSHRKIVGYELSYTIDSNGQKEYADKGDNPSGHGTHVAGTVAGNVLSSVQNAQSLSKMNGVAKDAKIHFTDIGQSDGSLVIPDDLNEFYSIAYTKSSARIHSNSWGCSLGGTVSCSYNCQCVWTRNNAYGNAGEKAKDSACQSMYGTKCCQICTRYDSWSQDVDQFTYDNDDMLILIAAGNYGKISVDTTVGSPSTAKNCLTIGASRTFNQDHVDSVDYMDFTVYYDYFKKNNVPVTNTDECCNYANNAVRSYCCPSVIKQMYQNNPGYYNKNNMASFSSRGPTFDGRLKPEVVAPGSYIISTHGDGDLTSNNCGSGRPNGANSAALMSDQGTSMATPATAGAAGLVRQYYRTKRSISNPSGMLIKATIIHSATVMKGTVDRNGQKGNQIIQLPQTTDGSPNIYNGYGLVSLTSALAFDDSSFKLVVDDRASLQQGNNKLYCFQSSSTESASNLKATLTWYDPPATPYAKNVLVNNLDLDIEELIVDTVIQNNTEIRRVRGNGGTENDDVNNTERAFMLDIPSSTFVAVRVNAKKVVSGSQKYAVVITHSKSMVQVAEEKCQFAATVSSASTNHPKMLYVSLLILFIVSLLM
jgi:subtilisin family serine protease